MKTFRLLVAIALLFGFSACSDDGGSDPGDTSCASITTAGLSAFYPFQGNSIDLASGLNGTDTGVVYVDDRFGNTLSAIRFDGVSSKVEIPHGLANELQEEFTLSIWVQPAQIKDQTIIRKGLLDVGADASPYKLEMTAGGDILFTISTETGSTYSVSASNYQIDRWIMISAILNFDELKLYVNETLVDSSIAEKELRLINEDVVIGTSDGTAATSFDGPMDVLRIYTRELCAEEIAILMTL